MGAIAAAGCAESRNEGPVASVGTTSITESEVNRWQAPIAVATGGGDDDEVRPEVLRYLIRSVWTRREAARQGVGLAHGDIARGIAELRGQFPSSAAFGDYLASQQLSRDLLRERVATDIVRIKLQRRLFGKNEVAPAMIRVEFQRHPERFREEPSRQLRSVTVLRRSNAVAARDMLRTGAPWGRIIDLYSSAPIDPGAGRTAVFRSNSIRGFRDRVFEAEPGEIVGPVAIGDAWTVFEVERKLPARKVPFREARPEIRKRLVARAEERSRKRLLRLLERRWAPLTTCAPPHVLADCERQP